MLNWDYIAPSSDDASRNRHSSRQRRTPQLSRRQLLRSVGAGVVATTMAGCSAISNGPQPLDETWSLPLTVRPDDASFNPFATANRTGLAFRYEPFARFDQTERAWEPVLATDWRVTDEAFEITLAEDRKWTNGDPVTAQDVTAFLDIATLFDDPLVASLSGWRVQDDSSVVLTTNGTITNPRILRHRILPRRLTVNRSAFENLTKRARAAESESARERVRTDVRTLGRKQLPTNGPYVVSELAEERIRYTISDAHPASDEDDRPLVETLHLPSPSEQWDAIRNGDIDGHDDLRLSSSQLDSLQDDLEATVVDGLGGNALFLQYDDEWFGDPRVRRAIAYLLDGTALADQIHGVPITENGMNRYVGMNNADLLNTWFADRSDYLSYEPDSERGEALLADAGLQKVDGVWTTPNGDPFEAPIKVAASWGVGSVIAQEVARQLGAAGIVAEVVRLGINRFQRHLERGDYRLAFATVDIDLWHPYGVYHHAFDSELAKTSWRFPDDIEIPMPVGGSDPTMVDARDLTARLRQPKSLKTGKSLIRTLGWVFNRTLPWIPSNKTVYSVLLTNDHWSYPEIPADGEPPASLKRLAPTVASNLAAAGTLTERFESK